MKKFLFSMLLACSSPISVAENILPPQKANAESVNRDMWSCLNKALRTASREGEFLRGLDKELLQGHSTSGHLFETTLGDPRPIEPRADGVLAPRESLFKSFGSTKRSDPYVVCLLLKGYRWESSKESGFELLQRMAAQNNVRAQAELGRVYYFGLGATRDNTLAFNMLHAAAMANDPDAQFYLAVLFSEGDGVLPSDELSAQWLKRASDLGHTQAQRALPKAVKIAEDRRKANAELALSLAGIRAAADKGDVESLRKLGNYSIEGIGVAQDAKSAIEWYKKAAQTGDSVSAREIGVIYDKGRGVPVDYAEAVKWYKVAADRGDAQAQYNLGVLMYYGVGTELNIEQAKNWMRRASDQNYQRATEALSSLP